MKKIMILSAFLVCFNVLAVEAEKITKEQTPGYEVDYGARDPFVKKAAPVAKKDKLRQGARKKSVNQGQVTIHGAMKGNNGHAIGIFNFGVLPVGNTKQVMIGGKKVEVTLLKLDMATMDAVLQVGKDTIKISKKGGKK